MKLERVMQVWKQQWGKSLEEVLSGISAKYKELVGIPWLNAHRLFDLRRWRKLRNRMPHWIPGNQKVQS